MSRTILMAAAALLVAGGVVAGATGVMLYARGASLGVSGQSETPVRDHGNWKDDDWIDEYRLTERSGRVFDSHELDGKVHVVSFFFAKCPNSCSTQNRIQRDIHREFGKQGVKFVSITVDPQRDTPAVLRDYAHEYGADENWLFLTGEMLHIERIGAEMYQVVSKENTHSDVFVVVDKNGEVRERIRWSEAAELAKLRKLLAELLTE